MDTPMDSSYRSYRHHLFTLHLWREPLGQDQYEWRGRVTDTSTGAIAYFRQWQELEGLLLTLLNDAAAPVAPNHDGADDSPTDD